MTVGTSGRDRVLARVRRALGRPAEGTDPVGSAAAADRMDRPRANTIPMRAQLQQPQLGELFEVMIEASAASFERVATRSEVPAAVARWCAEHEIPPMVVTGPASPLGELPWAGAGIEAERRLVRSGDPVGVAEAAAGIAETGTLAVLSGPENPVTANFLPEVQVILVRAADLVGTPEDLWALLRERGPLPRTVNWITGPSRTADIEMQMTMGAHGPTRLHVVLVED